MRWLIAASFAGALVLMLEGLRSRSRIDPRVGVVIAAIEAARPTRPEAPGNTLLVRTALVARARLGSALAPSLSRRPTLVRRLELAGDERSLQDIAATKATGALAAGALALASGIVVPTAAILAPVVGIVAWRLPDLALARRARARQANIESHTPELVELLVASSEAGLPPPAAFVRSARAMAGPLGTELKAATERVDLGAPWRSALDAVVARTEAPSLARLARTLARSQRVGASVRNSLRAVADDLRAERKSRAEELARRAPVKMLFPLVFLILPAFLLLTVGPVLLSTIRSLH